MASIVIIGAGIGGMSAAARLAKAGHEVTIYENSDRSGGKCRTEWFGDYAGSTGFMFKTCSIRLPVLRNKSR